MPPESSSSSGAASMWLVRLNSLSLTQLPDPAEPLYQVKLLSALRNGKNSTLIIPKDCN